jgi:hypothetical protein
MTLPFTRAGPSTIPVEISVGKWLRIAQGTALFLIPHRIAQKTGKSATSCFILHFTVREGNAHAPMALTQKHWGTAGTVRHRCA